MSGSQGLPVTKAGTASTTETRITFAAPFVRGMPNSNGTRPTAPARSLFVKQLTIKNNDATNNLIVRLNKAADVITILPKDKVTIDRTMINDITVKSSASTVAYDMVGTSS